MQASAIVTANPNSCNDQDTRKIKRAVPTTIPTVSILIHPRCAGQTFSLKYTHINIHRQQQDTQNTRTPTNKCCSLTDNYQELQSMSLVHWQCTEATRAHASMRTTLRTHAHASRKTKGQQTQTIDEKFGRPTEPHKIIQQRIMHRNYTNIESSSSSSPAARTATVSNSRWPC